MRAAQSVQQPPRGLALVGIEPQVNHQTGMGALLSDSVIPEQYDHLLSLAEELEVEILKMIDLRRSDGQSGNDVLSLLLRAHSDEGRVNDAELVGHVALLFAAAHLTTAHTFTWTLFLLA